MSNRRIHPHQEDSIFWQYPTAFEQNVSATSSPSLPSQPAPASSTPPPPSYQQAASVAPYYPPGGLMQPHQVYPTYYAAPHTSRSRFVSLVVIMSLLAVLYLTSNWAHPFVSHFEQQRLLFEQQQQARLGLLGPPPGSYATNSLTATAGSSNFNRKLPSLLARPLKQTPESMRLMSTEKVQQWFGKLAKPSTNRTCTTNTFWQTHHHDTNQARLKRLRWMCNIYGFYDRIFTYWHRSSNRRQGINGSRKFCSTLHCPLIVDDNYQTLTCFVQKVASTSMKQFFLYLADNPAGQPNVSNWAVEGQSKISNLTIFHQQANEELYRISPMYIHNIKDSSYFKTLFVRHPFVRLVSAFKDKAERAPEVEPYFYSQYWWPMLSKLAPTRTKESNPNRVTFREFVEELLLKTDPYQFDEHWAPIWTRCEPCYMHYDFIGKLENSHDDFKEFKYQINENLVNITIWENFNQQFSNNATETSNEKKNNNHSDIRATSDAASVVNDHQKAEDLKQCQLVRYKYAETARYLAQLPIQTLMKLYKIYYLDFELFGYTLEELFEVI